MKLHKGEKMFHFIKKKIEIKAPTKCQVIKLEEVTDEAFSKKIVGDGCAIIPQDGLICSPVDGEIILVFRTNHAIGIKSDEGVELLIHMGIDTVELEGKGFESLVKVGDRVKVGMPLSKIDINYIKSSGKSIQTPIVITNGYHVVKVDEGNKKIGDSIMKLVSNN